MQLSMHAVYTLQEQKGYAKDFSVAAVNEARRLASYPDAAANWVKVRDGISEQ